MSEGDSITASPALPDSYARLKRTEMISTHPFSAAFFMAAVGGSLQADLRSRAAAVDSVFCGSGTINIFSVLIGAGSSELGTDYTGVLGNGLDGWLADLAAYCDDRRAAGWTVILGTVISKTTPGFNAARNYVNPIMRTWVGVHVDAIADFAADPVMGPDAASSDTDLYSDGTHPTALGQSHLFDVFSPVFDSFMP